VPLGVAGNPSAPVPSLIFMLLGRDEYYFSDQMSAKHAVLPGGRQPRCRVRMCRESIDRTRHVGVPDRKKIIQAPTRLRRAAFSPSIHLFISIVWPLRPPPCP